MLRALYNWTMSLASSPRANIGLAVVSFAESSFFPIPPMFCSCPWSWQIVNAHGE